MYKLTVLSPQTDELMCLCLFFCLIASHFEGRDLSGMALKDGVALKMKKIFLVFM